MKKKRSKILRFIDNCTAHTATPTMTNVKVASLPPHTTLKLQPMDQGIIQNFKTMYHAEVVRLSLNSTDEKRIGDPITFANKAWNNVTQQTIANCFRHCGFGKEGMMSVEQVKELILDDVEAYSIIPSIVPKGYTPYTPYTLRKFQDNLGCT